jgi:hypothetical protein
VNEEPSDHRTAAKEGEGTPASKEASAEPAKEASAEPDVTAPDELLVDAQVAPGDRLWWLVWQASYTRQGIRIRGVEHGYIIREMGSPSAHVFVSPLSGMKEPLMGVLFDENEEVGLFDVRGVSMGGGRARLRAIPNSLTPCPDGEHVFLLAREQRPKKEGDGAEDAAGWACLPVETPERQASRKGARASKSARIPVHCIEGLRPSAPVAVATNAAARMIFVLFGSGSGGSELLGLEQPADPARSAELCEVFRVSLPRRTALLAEPSSGRAVAIVMRDEGFEFAELGREPPALGASAGAEQGEVPEEL